MGHGMDSRQLQLQLQSHLHHDPASVNEDLDRACRNARSCDLQSQGAMHWVFQSPRFKHWIQSPAPDALVVDGNLTDGMARYSATSLLCGMIIQSLVKQKAIHVLSFFCGSHNSRYDPLSGPGGLLRSLISQLLSIQQFDVGFLKFGQWIEGPLINDIRTLSRLFGRLFEQLPNTVIFCIIDGFSILEDETWAWELQLVLKTLISTVTEGQANARLKLLITSTTRSRFLNGLMNDGDRLLIPTEGGDQRFLTSRSMDYELADDRRQPMYRTADRSSYESIYDSGFE
jgi:hypothetical protein